MSASYKGELDTDPLKCPTCGRGVMIDVWEDTTITRFGVKGSFAWGCPWCETDGYVDFWAPWHELVIRDGDFNEYTWKWPGSETPSNRKPTTKKAPAKRATATKKKAPAKKKAPSGRKTVSKTSSRQGGNMEKTTSTKRTATKRATAKRTTGARR